MRFPHLLVLCLLALLTACSTPSSLRYSTIQVPVMRPAQFALSPEVKSIAVTGFIVRADAPGLDERAVARGVEDGVAGKVRRQGFLEIIERQHLEYAMRELERGFEDAFDQETAAEFGKLAQAQAVIFGEVAVSLSENVGPFQRESPVSVAARDSWERRKSAWEDSQSRVYQGWQQRRKSWDDAENRLAVQSSTENLLLQLNAMQTGKQAALKQNYVARPFPEREPIPQPFLEPQPYLQMVIWNFIEQRPSVQVTAKMVEVESGSVVGSTRFVVKGRTYRDENESSYGLRREDPDKLVQPLIAQAVAQLTQAITPHQSVVTRKAASLDNSDYQIRLDRSVHYIQEAAPELAEPILAGIRSEIDGKSSADPLVSACVENNSGIVAEARGDFDSALRHYRLAIEEDPDNQVFVKHYADLKRVAEEHKQATRQSGPL
jgi:tetratricopeptide (TPR) repeat protein